MLKPNVSPLGSNSVGYLSRPKIPTATLTNKLRLPGKGRYLLWREMKLSWREENYSRRQTSKTWKDGSHNCLFSSLCWLMRAWMRATVILTLLLCPPSFQKLSKPAWALKSLGEGKRIWLTSYKTMHFQQNLQSYAKKGLSTEQNKTYTQCILKIMTLSEAQSKRLKILSLV